MPIDDDIESFNNISSQQGRNDKPFRTTDELRAFFRNPHEGRSQPSREAATGIVEMFRSAGEIDRLRISSMLGHDSQRALQSFAAETATLAVRHNSEDLIGLGLSALALLRCDTDLRDSIVVLARLYHAAIKLGIDAEGVFRDVSALAVEEGMRAEMSGSPRRQPQDRALAAFFLREETTPDGFAFVQVVPRRSSTEG